MKNELFKILAKAFSQGHLISFSQLIGHREYSKDELENEFQKYENITKQHYLNKLINNSCQFEEIIIHSATSIYIKSQRTLQPAQAIQLSSDELHLSFKILASKKHLSWNYNEPVISFDYDSKFRITLLHYSATTELCSKLFLRSTPQNTLTLKDFTNTKISQYLLDSLADHKNIIISGANSSGKTTLLKSLITHLPHDQHLAILEDFHELKIEHPHCTHLIENSKNSSKTLSAYCNYILRMAVDRLIIGEIRSAEVVPFLMAINTGMQGVISTIHANSARDVIERLSLLFSLYSEQDQINYLQIEQLICQNIDLIIYLKDKRIDHVIEIKGHCDGRPIYKKLIEAI